MEFYVNVQHAKGEYGVVFPMIPRIGDYIQINELEGDYLVTEVCIFPIDSDKTEDAVVKITDRNLAS